MTRKFSTAVVATGVATVAAIAIAVPAFADNGWPGPGHMRGDRDDHPWAWLMIGGLGLLAIAAIVALALGLTRRPATSAVATGPAPAAPMAAMSPTANAEAILAERLARSEITSDDYRTMLAALRGGPDAPAAPGVDAPAG
ncbi:MAG: hypothetical protein R2694_07015 [Ilumatobacteraceae bacterium]|nr:hypothetical protein [Ilumatobacter sp.]MCB0984146.1 hypothetical protein [Ilumatobacter sp.]